MTRMTRLKQPAGNCATPFCIAQCVLHNTDPGIHGKRSKYAACQMCHFRAYECQGRRSNTHRLGSIGTLVMNDVKHL